MFLFATIFSTVFGLVNLLFAFYNLYLLISRVIRPLKGMRMKINLGEKALMERRLPTDIMSKILSSAENANNGTPRKRSKSASEDATSDDQKKSGKKKKKSGSDDFVSEDRKKRSSTEEGNNDVQKKTSSEDDPNQRRSFECAAFENAMKKSFEA